MSFEHTTPTEPDFQLTLAMRVDAIGGRHTLHVTIHGIELPAVELGKPESDRLGYHVESIVRLAAGEQVRPTLDPHALATRWRVLATQHEARGDRETARLLRERALELDAAAGDLG